MPVRLWVETAAPLDAVRWQDRVTRLFLRIAALVKRR
jgi:hypothetical protein